MLSPTNVPKRGRTPTFDTDENDGSGTERDVKNREAQES